MAKRLRTPPRGGQLPADRPAATTERFLHSNHQRPGRQPVVLLGGPDRDGRRRARPGCQGGPAARGGGVARRFPPEHSAGEADRALHAATLPLKGHGTICGRAVGLELAAACSGQRGRPDSAASSATLHRSQRQQQFHRVALVCSLAEASESPGAVSPVARRPGPRRRPACRLRAERAHASRRRARRERRGRKQLSDGRVVRRPLQDARGRLHLPAARS